MVADTENQFINKIDKRHHAVRQLVPAPVGSVQIYLWHFKLLLKRADSCHSSSQTELSFPCGLTFIILSDINQKHEIVFIRKKWLAFLEKDTTF